AASARRGGSSPARSSRRARTARATSCGDGGARRRQACRRAACPGAAARAPRTTPAEVEVAAEAARGIESADGLEDPPRARGIGGLRKRQHGMAEGAIGAQRPHRLVALDEPLAAPGRDGSGREAYAVGFESG